MPDALRGAGLDIRVLDDLFPQGTEDVVTASVREGLEETLTVLTLGLSDRLRQSLATTNAIETPFQRCAAL